MFEVGAAMIVQSVVMGELGQAEYRSYLSFTPTISLCMPPIITHCVTARSQSLSLLLTQEDEEESMGDVDLWAIVDEGRALTVNDKWLQHLQVCVCVWWGRGRGGVNDKGLI